MFHSKITRRLVTSFLLIVLVSLSLLGILLLNYFRDYTMQQEKNALILNAKIIETSLEDQLYSRDIFGLHTTLQELHEKTDLRVTVIDADGAVLGDTADPEQTMNNHSACAMLQFGEARMFLAADIGGETQHWLLDTFGAETFKCDVYKTAHHNRTATVTEFLDAMDPGLAVNTNTRSSTPIGEKQQDRRDIPRYYISTGTIHLSTDGTQWYVWQEKME